MLSYGSKRLGKVNLGKISAVIERILTNELYSLGQGYLGKIVIASECSVDADHEMILYGCGNCYVGKALICINKVSKALLDIICKTVNLKGLGCANLGIKKRVGNAVRNNVIIAYGTNTTPHNNLRTVAENVRADGLNRLIHNEGVEVVTTIECLVADGCKLLVNKHADKIVAIVERTITNLKNAATEGNAVNRIVILKNTVVESDYRVTGVTDLYRRRNRNVRCTTKILGQLNTCAIHLVFPIILFFGSITCHRGNSQNRKYKTKDENNTYKFNLLSHSFIPFNFLSPFIINLLKIKVNPRQYAQKKQEITVQSAISLALKISKFTAFLSQQRRERPPRVCREQPRTRSRVALMPFA